MTKSKSTWRFAVVFSNGKKFFVTSIFNAYELVTRFREDGLTFRLESLNIADHERSHVHN